MELMVEPTARMLRVFDQYGAKLTIMADVAEILKFKEYADTRGQDAYHYREVVAQLQQAIRGGHDVQLHIHASYFNATHDGRSWRQDWSEYDFAGLPQARLDEVVGIGKRFLESLLQPVQPGYRCSVFRAANWSVSPSERVVRALTRHGFSVDTSVFKYGRREGRVSFDYASAPSEMMPWLASDTALWRPDPRGRIWEVPIYAERRGLLSFFSLNRIYRACLGRLHRFPKVPGDGVDAAGTGASARRRGRFAGLLGKHAWKADFNQCTGRQLLRALNRAAGRHDGPGVQAPFVLIGHSKLFTAWNEASLRPFLRHVKADPSRFRFGTFHDLQLPAPAGAVG